MARQPGFFVFGTGVRKFHPFAGPFATSEEADRACDEWNHFFWEVKWWWRNIYLLPCYIRYVGPETAEFDWQSNQWRLDFGQVTHQAPTPSNVGRSSCEP